FWFGTTMIHISINIKDLLLVNSRTHNHAPSGGPTSVPCAPAFTSRAGLVLSPIIAAYNGLSLTVRPISIVSTSSCLPISKRNLSPSSLGVHLPVNSIRVTGLTLPSKRFHSNHLPLTDRSRTHISAARSAT